MLQLKNIEKIYESGDTKVTALKGISLNFRKSEFVSILGQSGCGKTTLLNIVGGLDQYTSGDLVINGKSTKQFKDSDWDTYRNHSIGFVFQSYNLISHQTVLANVELALTLSGVSKKERRERAIEALKKVGLGDQINKRPNQMSGGQMQRVAIARALINDPEILLADEPTGALDSQTSVQIMELLKEISKDRLIIMVTHNPELAEQYSTRIIRLFDGNVKDDSMPLSDEEAKQHITATKDKGKKASMSFATAIGLSFNNLMTKKGRTFLTSFAGSIGIIGIALILSLSDGFQKYIDKVQEDTLSNYPIAIQSETTDMSGVLRAMAGNADEEAEKEEPKEKKKATSVKVFDASTDMYNALLSEKTVNDLAEFKKFLDDEANGFAELTSDIKYGYDIYPKIFGTDLYGKTLRVNPSTVMEAMGMGNMTGMYSMFSSMSMMGSDMDAFGEMIGNDELLESQYDVLAGRWPKDKSELVFVVSRRGMVQDTYFYTLGLKDQKDYEAFLTGATIPKSGKDEYSFDEILSLRFKVVADPDLFVYDEATGSYNPAKVGSTELEDILKNALELKIVGIIAPKEGIAASAISSTIGYRRELTEYLLVETEKHELVQKQLADKETDVFTGKPFKGTESAENQSGDFDMSTLPPEQQAYLATLSPAELQALMAQMAEAQVSTATYEGNLEILGLNYIEEPDSINIYPKDFESKEIIQDKIDAYNDQCEAEGREAAKISYTDFIGILMSSVSTIINAITYVLIAFVAISLVVSSIMIGIITYISVLERTKEIGVLRSIGASKRDVSRVFNAETLLVGLVSGGLGVGITVILNIPINMIIEHFSGLKNIAALPLNGAIVLVIISMALTLIAGLIPSRIAAKKDPVEALRSE